MRHVDGLDRLMVEEMKRRILEVVSQDWVIDEMK